MRTECHLKRGASKDLLERAARVRPTLELDDEANSVAIRLVPNVGDVVDLPPLRQPGDLLDDLGLVHGVGQLGDDQLLLAATKRLLHDPGPHDDPAAAFAVHLLDALPTDDEAGRREVRPRDVPHEVVDGAVGIHDQLSNPRGDLRQVVRRNIGAHPDRDTRRAVDQKIREAARQYRRLQPLIIEVGLEVDGLLFDLVEQLEGDRRQPRLGVPVGGGRVTVDRPEVALPVDQRITERELLHHPDEGIVDGAVSVRMELAEHVPDHGRALLVRTIRIETHLVHGVQDSPMYGLESVPDIREGALHDDGHRVVEKRFAHLLFEGAREDPLPCGGRGHSSSKPSREGARQRPRRGCARAISGEKAAPRP
jgi:hypothetical protein